MRTGTDQSLNNNIIRQETSTSVAGIALRVNRLFHSHDLIHKKLTHLLWSISFDRFQLRAVLMSHNFMMYAHFRAHVNRSHSYQLLPMQINKAQIAKKIARKTCTFGAISQSRNNPHNNERKVVSQLKWIRPTMPYALILKRKTMR